MWWAVTHGVSYPCWGRPRSSWRSMCLLGSPPLFQYRIASPEFPTVGVRLRPRRDPPGNSVEPAGDGVCPPDGCSLAREDQERSLEGILGILPVAQDLAANAQDHRPVPLHECRECGLRRRIALGEEPLEQLPVRKGADDPDLGQGPQLAQEVITAH